MRGTERLRFLPKFTQLADWQSRTQILNRLIAHAVSTESFSQLVLLYPVAYCNNCFYLFSDSKALSPRLYHSRVQ